MLFLIPPSEGKNPGGSNDSHQPLLDKPLPFLLAKKASKKDLKCSGSRYDEGIVLNKNITDSLTLPAIQRYTGTMFKTIAYDSLSNNAKKFFDNHVCIISGMYGIVHPQTLIGNYKLPISTKGLIEYRGDTVTEYINTKEKEYIVDLLPQAHKKLIHWKSLSAQRMQVDFYHGDKKLAHGVKGVKGFWLHTVSMQAQKNPKQRSKSFLYKKKTITVKIT